MSSPTFSALVASPRTLGISPKVLAPIAASLAAVVEPLAVSGTLSRPALGALSVAVVGALFSYVVGPGAVYDAASSPETFKVPTDKTEQPWDESA